MGSVYKRGNIWWMKIYNQGEIIRKSTKRHVKAKAINMMEKTERKLKGNAPKVLLFDIETSPLECYVWTFWQKYIDPMTGMKKDWSVLSWSAKWLFDNKIMSQKVTPREAMNREDKSIIKKMWKLLEEADIVIAHNGRKFDVRKINTRFLKNGLGPPMTYSIIDTLEVLKRNFLISSNKLDYVNRFLDIDRKIETSMKLWDRCVTGDKSALKEMEDYNRQDVVALEELYMILRPWMKSHPNMSLYVDTGGKRCPTCNSYHLKEKGHYYTPAGKYGAFRCLDCGAIGRRRYTAMTMENRRNTILSAAR